MKEQKQPHEKMTMTNNGLSKTQEVVYQKEFNRADKATENNNNRPNKKQL